MNNEDRPARKSALKRIVRLVLAAMLGCAALLTLLVVLAPRVEGPTGPVEITWRGVDSGYNQITVSSPQAATKRSPDMSKRRTSAIFFIVLLILAASVAAYAAYNYGRRSVPLPAEPTIEIEKLARLATVKVTVADVLQAGTGSGLTDVKGAWLVKGDALLTVDMSQSQTISKDAVKKTIVLRLPKPTVYQPRVDHSKTITYDVRKGLLVFGTGKESRMRDEAMKQAQLLVEHAATSPETLQIARDVAEQVVRAIYKAVDWDVTIVWGDEEAPPAPTAQP